MLLHRAQRNPDAICRENPGLFPVAFAVLAGGGEFAAAIDVAIEGKSRTIVITRTDAEETLLPRGIGIELRIHYGYGGRVWTDAGVDVLRAGLPQRLDQRVVGRRRGREEHTAERVARAEQERRDGNRRGCRVGGHYAAALERGPVRNIGSLVLRVVCNVERVFVAGLAGLECHGEGRYAVTWREMPNARDRARLGRHGRAHHDDRDGQHGCGERAPHTVVSIDSTHWISPGWTLWGHSPKKEHKHYTRNRPLNVSELIVIFHSDLRFFVRPVIMRAHEENA